MQLSSHKSILTVSHIQLYLQHRTASTPLLWKQNSSPMLIHEKNTKPILALPHLAELFQCKVNSYKSLHGYLQMQCCFQLLRRGARSLRCVRYAIAFVVYRYRFGIILKLSINTLRILIFQVLRVGKLLSQGRLLAITYQF